MANYYVSGHVLDVNGQEKFTFSNSYNASSETEARRLFLIDMLGSVINNLDTNPFTPQKAEVTNIQLMGNSYNVTLLVDRGLPSQQVESALVTAPDENHARAVAMQQWLSGQVGGDTGNFQFQSIEATSVQQM